MSPKHDATVSSDGRLHFIGTTVVILNAQNALGDALLKFLLSQGANVVAKVIEPRGNLPPSKGRLVGEFTSTTTESSLIQAAIKEFGTFHIIVNLVDIASDSPIADSVVEDWQSSVQGPLKAAYKVRWSVCGCLKNGLLISWHV